MKVTTREQRVSLHKLWLRGDISQVGITYLKFRRTFLWGIGGDHLFGPWQGIWFGIELDGTTHT